MIITFSYLHSLWVMFSNAMQTLSSFFSTRWSDIAASLLEGDGFEPVLGNVLNFLVGIFGDSTFLEYMLSIGLVVTLIWGVINLYWKLID